MEGKNIYLKVTPYQLDLCSYVYIDNNKNRMSDFLRVGSVSVTGVKLRNNSLKQSTCVTFNRIAQKVDCHPAVLGSIPTYAKPKL